MTKLVESKSELESFINEFSNVSESSNIYDIRTKLKDKDEQYFLSHALVIQVSRVESSDYDVQVKNIIYDEECVHIELSYTYVGTHLRQNKDPVAWITIIGVLKSRIAGRKIVVKDNLETFYIDEVMENKEVYTYYAKLNDKQEQAFWHVRNYSQMESAMQVIREKYTDDREQYGGLMQSVGQIDWDCQDMVLALIGKPSGLMKEFSRLEAYKVKLDGIIDIEMGCIGREDIRQKDTIGIVVIPLQKDEICDHKVVVDFR